MPNDNSQVLYNNKFNDKMMMSLSLKLKHLHQRWRSKTSLAESTFNNCMHSIASINLTSSHKFADDLRTAGINANKGCPGSPLMNNGRRNSKHLITPLFPIATNAITTRSGNILPRRQSRYSRLRSRSAYPGRKNALCTYIMSGISRRFTAP